MVGVSTVQRRRPSTNCNGRRVWLQHRRPTDTSRIKKDGRRGSEGQPNVVKCFYLGFYFYFIFLSVGLFRV